MDITLNINDKVWADFIIYLEKEHEGCDCKAEPGLHVSVIIGEAIIANKVQLLREQKEAEFMKNHNLSEPAFSKSFLLGSKTVEEIGEQVRRWRAEYREADPRY